MTTADEVPPASPAPALLFPVLVGVTAIVSIVSSLGAPLVPSVASSLNVSIEDAQWSLTVALLSATIAAPIMGRLGDGPHRREAVIAGLLVVLVGSIVAGVGQSLGVILVGRALQGVGLGLAPLAMATARHHLPPERAAEAIGVLSVTAAAGVGAGYPISGLIAERFDVRVAFAFGGVMSGAALIAAMLVIPSSRGSRRVPLDLRGAAVLAVALTALLLAITQAGSESVSGAWIAVFVTVAASAFLVWVRLQLSAPNPLFDLRHLRDPAVIVAILAALVLGFAMYMFLSLVTEFVQGPSRGGGGFEVSPLVAGLCLIPFSVMSVGASRTVRPLVPRLGTPALLTIGSLVITAGGAFFALVHDALWQAFVAMGLVGLGFGWTFAALPMFLARLVPVGEIGSVMGFYQVVRYIGFTSGSALAGAILGHHTAGAGRHPSEFGYEVALWVGVVACVIAAALPLLSGFRRSVEERPVRRFEDDNARPVRTESPGDVTI